MWWNTMQTQSLTAPPLVSIGVPVYNAEPTLRRSLESLLAQDYSNFEIVISDNCSSDASLAICRQYAAQHANVRIHVNTRNIGASGNFLKVLSHARGEYFMWAAADDYWAPDFVSCLVAEL